MNILTQKPNNFEYAPGMATYGINGRSGKQGKPGNGIFFTDYDLRQNAQFKKFVSKLQNSKMPYSSKDVDSSREYVDGDYFFDINGIVYRLADTDAVASLDVQNSEISDGGTSMYAKYVQICGQLKNTVDDSYISKNSAGRILLNNGGAGVDIICTGSQQIYSSDSDSALRICSNTADADGNISFIGLSTYDNASARNDLEVYYDSNMNGFHISSDYPIFIDSDLKVKNSLGETQYDGYSAVQTTETPITSFYNLCSSINYSYSSGIVRISLENLSEHQKLYFDGIRDATLVKFTYTDSSSAQTSKMYRINSLIDDAYKQQYSYFSIPIYDTMSSDASAAGIATFNGVSLIYNIEVYLHQA